MDEATGRALARDIIGPCGLLGYLVGTGGWWRDDGSLKRGKRAIGQVMGCAYSLLGPVWQKHPLLDPGQVPNALGLAERSTSLQDKPEDLLSLLHELEQAVGRALPVLEEQLPSAGDHFRRAAGDVLDSIAQARQVVARHAPNGAPP
jgi:hypothetical protein